MHFQIKKKVEKKWVWLFLAKMMKMASKLWKVEENCGECLANFYESLVFYWEAPHEIQKDIF